MRIKLGPVVLHPVKLGAWWHLVSSRYAPPRLGSVGSGMIDATRYRTRELARQAWRKERAACV